MAWPPPTALNPIYWRSGLARLPSLPIIPHVNASTASKDIEAITMKNGRAATRSTCVDCGTKKFRIGVLP